MSATHGTWGDRYRIYDWDSGLVTVLDLEPHQRCSYHSHRHSYNLFFVVEGELGVKTDKGYTSKIGPFQSFEVEPGVAHEFQTYDLKTKIVEVAYVKYDVNDIYRSKLGGPLDGRNESAGH